jgi:hypothetical protein
MDGMSSLDETTLQRFSDIFKHFQIGKPDEDDEVSISVDLKEIKLCIIIVR